MYTALLQVIIYQLAEYEKDPIKNGREIAERRKWERNKIIKKKKEKTIQQQKGLPTLSADLKNKRPNICHYRIAHLITTNPSVIYIFTSTHIKTTVMIN